MLNFRKLKQDFSPSIVKEGKDLYDKGSILSAKILQIDSDKLRLCSKVRGQFDNVYENEIEIDRFESKTVDSNCDCTYTYDCQHIAALVFYLENHLDEILVNFSKENDLDESEKLDEEEKEDLRKTLQKAITKHDHKLDEKMQTEILQEYINAASLLSESPFFLHEEAIHEDKAELLVLFNISKQFDNSCFAEIQLALRLPFRSKPLNVVNLKDFIDSVRYVEPLYISGKRYFFTPQSFDLESHDIVLLLLDHLKYSDTNLDRSARSGFLDQESFGILLAKYFERMYLSQNKGLNSKEGYQKSIPCLFQGNFESPLQFSLCPVAIRFELEYLKIQNPKILLKPLMVLENKKAVLPQEGILLDCLKPGFIYNNTYYRFSNSIKRLHLKHLNLIRDMTIPEPLFGTFIENALPEVQRYCEILGGGVLDKCITLPFTGDLKAKAVAEYLDGELEVKLWFLYDKIEVPASSCLWTYNQISSFIQDVGILARNLTEEKKIVDDLFSDFVFDSKNGVFIAKTEKKIVEFMTEVIPRNRDRVEFVFPDNLLDQFIYDASTFDIHFRESNKKSVYEVELKVNGALVSVNLSLLWECVSLKKNFIELEAKASAKSRAKSKILVLNLETLTPIVTLFDEIGIDKLDNCIIERPLWSLVSWNESSFEGLKINYTISKTLQNLREQILGDKILKSSAIPKSIKADLRNYQKEGVEWLEKLRKMYLNGILADDMGLGKTLQTITALTQNKQEDKNSISLIVCPTSLLYNWKAEFTKFNPSLKVLLIDGVPSNRKKLLSQIKSHDVIVTTYTLLQKDIETYKALHFSYIVLDEAQHIKNRGTRNAKSVKMIEATHRLILTGTPVENSLDELWSLFDFLMPGLLSSYERFVEKYIKNVSGQTGYLETLRKKIAPFVLRRMKEEVLEDLPPVSEIIYYSHLSPLQKELYTSYAQSAREELSKLVQKEGFDKVQIHVLATLTRLKQICCHPAIFAKEQVEEADSAKYDMFLELLEGLIDGKHKTVVFSQYTKMLTILREELTSRGIRFSYLDGTTKNRLEIVNDFNQDPLKTVFLVSLKAGGSGLNIVGADTVIHYDMWWNPAVENQATDRVHRLGQKRAVSSYKLITLGTIEEKIMNMQNRKKGLVKKIVSCDDEAMAKLTWEEVLELLQT
jgi:SNF2 family DNA or RNA helicase